MVRTTIIVLAVLAFSLFGCFQFEDQHYICEGGSVMNSKGYEMFTIDQAITESNSKNLAKSSNWNSWLLKISRVKR